MYLYLYIYDVKFEHQRLFDVKNLRRLTTHHHMHTSVAMLSYHVIVLTCYVIIIQTKAGL